MRGIAKSTYRFKARFQVWLEAYMKIIKMFRSLTCSSFVSLCVLYYLVLTYYFFKNIMFLDVDFVSELDTWGPKYA